MTVPPIRIRTLNTAAINPTGDYVLYWMAAFRRPVWNFALDRAVEWAKALDKPLLVFEPLSSSYRWASARFHNFVSQGMVDNAIYFGRAGARYLPYIEPEHGAGLGLLQALGQQAALVVGDDHPGSDHVAQLNAAAAQLPVFLEAVDSCGLLPIRQPGREFRDAPSFRRYLQGALPEQLAMLPAEDSLTGAELPKLTTVPERIRERWSLIAGFNLAALPIDHSVGPVSYRGGVDAANERVEEFFATRLVGYAEAHSQPERDSGSRLSAYLHYGHLSPHELFWRLADWQDWDPMSLAAVPSGRRTGWWGMTAGAEAFLDQLVTWRELAFNTSLHRPDCTSFDSLPDWARTTLEKHAGDPRAHVYSLDQFEQARTHDESWNAAQRQLVENGHIPHPQRLLWGKRILEWSESPREAMVIMVELNNKYAVGGRDPNSYAGIGWTLGRYDTPCPERPVFGRVRHLSSGQATPRRTVSLVMEVADHGALP